MHTHIVLFWLKEPANQDHLCRFENGLNHLMQDERVQEFTIGTPADTSRDVVQNDYTFGVVAKFADLAAHNAYQTGTHHDDFLEQCAPLWARVQVVDLNHH